MNLLLITVDELRADRLSCLGYGRETTPSLDRLAEDGLTYSNATALSEATLYSFLSLFSSTYPSMFGGGRSLPERGSFVPLIRSEGYTTMAFLCNPFISRAFGFGEGFDVFFDDLSVIKESKSPLRKLRGLLAKEIRKLPFSERIGELFTEAAGKLGNEPLQAPAQEMKDLLLSGIRNGNRPFFAWVHFMDLHWPRFPPKEFLTPELDGSMVRKVNWGKGKLSHSERMEKISKLYDCSLRYVDSVIGEIAEELSGTGILEETWVMVTGDHGEGMGEHGYLGHQTPSLHEERIRVPLLVWGPDLSGKKVDEPISHLDVAPTILDLLEIDADFGRGRPLPRLSENERGSDVFLESGVDFGQKKPIPDRVAHKEGEWKYIQKNSGRDELYNLERDPLEKENLIGDRGEKRRVMCGKIADHLSKVSAFNEKHSEKTLIKEKVRRLKEKGEI